MTVKDDTSIKSSYQSKSMGHFRRNKKSDTIDFPELDETNQNVPIDAGIGHTQVDVEAKEESALQNIVNPQHVEERAQSLQVSQLVDTAKVDIIGANDSSSLPKATIAYAVSLTSCGASNMADGAAVLKHSIALSSYPLNKNSKYAYKIFAFVHPQAVECSEPFEKLGYEVQIRETPIDASKIRGEFLREHVVKSGCCQEKEFLKLYAYTLTEFPVVVHLDIDSLILQPFDDLFDSMIDGDNGKLPMMHNKTAPDDIQAFYTKDYNMIGPGHRHPGVQGGFIVIKPNLDYFEEYRQTILKGHFVPGGGWGGSWGGYFGAQQIQGLCSYFFENLHSGTEVELNRCIYNSMSDNPKGLKRGKNPEKLMICRDGEATCEDCRTTSIEKVKSVHFTLCQKPWTCPSYVLDKGQCAEFHKKWFSIRKDWEESSGLVEKIDSSAVNYRSDIFHGYCKGQGEYAYTKISLL